MKTGSQGSERGISTLTATAIVVANMVGTGIFTSLGFQVGPLPSGFSIMVLWLVGGICALCGALSYAELAAALPRSGGEYNFLGKIYHPAAGFLAGFISVTVGFAAPVAAAASVFGSYLHGVIPTLPSFSIGSLVIAPELLFAVALVALATLPLLYDIKFGSAFQDAATILKLVLILAIIAASCLVKNPQPVSFMPAQGDGSLIMSAGFAISLYWVMYSYSGWNASTYITGEMRNPARGVPLSVTFGTLLVMGLYLAVNAALLRSAPVSAMVGKEAVALAAGPYLFGAAGQKIVALLICIGLISTVSSMMWIGPRVTVAMGEDLRALRWLGRLNGRGLPVTATLLQFVIAIALLLTSSFKNIVNYVQFSLTLCSALVVLGVFVLRWRQPDLPRPYRTWGYPVTPLIFLSISGWMLYYMLAEESTRQPSLLGFATILLGLLIYFLSPKSATIAPSPSVSHET